MRVLLTGAAGFIGSHIADAMIEHGHDVVGLDNLLPQAHGDVDASTAAPVDHGFVRGDVREADVLAGLLDGVDVVCHQAAMVGHGLSPADAPEYASHNDFGTATLLAAMHSAGVRRLVLASSMVVYGEGRYRCREHGDQPAGQRRLADIEAGQYDPPCPTCGRALEPALVPEHARLEPRSTYAASKLAQEHYATAWALQTGGRVIALRYHNVYGPRMPRDTPYAGVAAIFRSALERGQPPRVLEDGKQRRDFVHVTDVALANVLAAQGIDEIAAGTMEPVNICSGQPHTVGELAAELARASAGPAPKIVGGARPNDVRHVVADPAKAARLLGFRARVEFADGVRAFATDPLRAPASLTR